MMRKNLKKHNVKYYVLNMKKTAKKMIKNMNRT